MSSNLFKKELANLPTYVPGKPIEEVKKELGLTVVHKLASNENPLGPSAKAIKRIKEAADFVNIYPDATATELRKEIAKVYDLDYTNVIVGNGGEQVIQMIAQTFINEGDEAIMADTTFGLYASSVALMGGKAIKVPLKNYKHDFETFVSKVNNKTKLIYVCNPNNPLGNIMNKEDVKYLLENIPEEIVVVFDEAYYHYARINGEYPDSLEILKKRPNTIILRTFSKVAGIAGVRVGFALTSEKIAMEMTKVKGVFNVNRLAQAAALGALEDADHINKTVELNYKTMKMMEDYCENKGLEYIKSNANFMFINIGVDSKEVFNKLMEKGVIIRGGFLWKWDSWIRVSTGTVEQIEYFIKALDEILCLASNVK